MSSPAGPGATPTPADFFAVLDLTIGFWKTAMVHALARFDICDAIEQLADAEGTASATEVAQRCGTDARATYRLLRATSALGVVVESPGQRFALTGRGKVLTASNPLSAKNAVLYEGCRTSRELWLEFEKCLLTGKTVVPEVRGVDSLWQLLDSQPDLAKLFNLAMTSISHGQVQGVLEAYDFTGTETLVDVAGGEGLVARMVLERYPTMRARVIDLPDVCKSAEVPAALAPRLEFAPFDLFDAASYPRDFDVYFLKNILHDWDDAHSLTILQHLSGAMKPSSRVLIAEAGITAPNQPGFGKLMDLHMLLMVNGAERTREEFALLAAQAGLVVARVVDAGGVSVVEMRKA